MNNTTYCPIHGWPSYEDDCGLCQAAATSSIDQAPIPLGGQHVTGSSAMLTELADLRVKLRDAEHTAGEASCLVEGLKAKLAEVTEERDELKKALTAEEALVGESREEAEQLMRERSTLLAKLKIAEEALTQYGHHKEGDGPIRGCVSLRFPTKACTCGLKAALRQIRGEKGVMQRAGSAFPELRGQRWFTLSTMAGQFAVTAHQKAMSFNSMPTAFA